MTQSWDSQMIDGVFPTKAKEPLTMPAKYEAIRDQAIKEGLSTKMAKQKAAKIFNATRPAGTPPVTRSSDKPATHKKEPRHG